MRIKQSIEAFRKLDKKVRSVFIVGLLLFIGSTLLFVGNSGTAEIPVSLRPKEILPQLQGPHEDTQRLSSIPVLLPTEVPGVDNFWVWPTLSQEGTRYIFSIDLTEECEGSGSCSRGSFGGELITEETETLEVRYEHLATGTYRGRSEEPQGPVSLSSGIEGVFIPWVAPAQCTEARIYWLDGDVRYHVGIECGSQADLTTFANSVIDNTDRGE